MTFESQHERKRQRDIPGAGNVSSVHLEMAQDRGRDTDAVRVIREQRRAAAMLASQRDRQASRHRAMTIIAHLEEFRRRLIRCVILIAILSFCMYAFSQDMIEWLKRMVSPELKSVVFTSPLELFTIKLKVGLYLALCTSIPYVAFEVWQFIAPGLFRKERRQVILYALISTVFFIIGGAFALFVIYPAVMRFSLKMSSNEVTPMITVESFIGLGAMLVLGFGIMFQLPIVVYSCVSRGIVKPEAMAKMRPYIIIFISVVSAILTPPDILSMVAMGLPTYILFEISLLLARLRFQKLPLREK